MRFFSFKTILFFIFYVYSSRIQSQELTEAEVNRQKQFMDVMIKKIQGKEDEAIPILNDLIRQDHKNAELYFELGKIYESKSDVIEAEKNLKFAADLDTSNSWYLSYLATFHEKGGKKEESLQDYLLLLKRFPDQLQYYKICADLLHKNNQHAEVIQLYNNYELTHGITDESVHQKYRSYLMMGQGTQAVQQLIQYVQKKPKDIELLHEIVQYYQQQQDETNVRVYLDKILSINPTDARARMSMNSSSNSNDPVQLVMEDKAISFDEKMKILIPRIKALSVSLNNQEGEKLLQYLDILSIQFPSDAKVAAGQGDVYNVLGKNTQAIAAYEKSLQYAKSNAMVWEQLCGLYKTEGLFVKLKSTSEAALDFFPNRSIFYLYSGISKMVCQDMVGGGSDFDQFQSMMGNQPALQEALQLAKVEGFLVLNDVKSAETLFSSMEKKSLPKDLRSKLEAWIYILQGNLLKAQELIGSMNANPEINYLKMLAAYKQRNYVQAKSISESIPSSSSLNNPLMLELIGDIHYRLNDINAALDYWNKAKMIYIKKDKIEKKIQNRGNFE